MTVISARQICDPCLFTLKDQTLKLLPEKAIFWQEEKLLFMADVHLGKVNHFRKSGIPVPTKLVHDEIDRLSRLLDTYEPETLCVLGDLFHSHRNKEWEIFAEWRARYPHVHFELVRGNHDIIASVHYKQADIKVYLSCVEKGPFLFTHEPTEKCLEGLYPFAGHIHPGIYLTGKARQSLRLPCFYFGKEQALLPAFGAFTGLAIIEPKRGDAVFAVADDVVLRI
jgi:DNA ligase-associated metallophosphoesterase